MLLDDETQHEGLANKRKTPTIRSSGNLLQFAVKAMAIYFVDLPNLKMLIFQFAMFVY